QVGLEKRRANTADVNTGIPQLLAEGFGEGNHAGLGDVVAVHQGRQHEAGHGGDVNEGAGTLLLELRRKRLTATDHAQNVDIKNPFPVTNGGVFNGACGGNASVVDHNIYPTPLLDQIVPDFLEIAQATNIAFHKIAFATGPVEFCLNGHALLRVDIPDADFGAFFGVSQCNRPAQTTGPAGYEYPLCHRCFSTLCLYFGVCDPLASEYELLPGKAFQNTLLRHVHVTLELRHPWLRTVLEGLTRHQLSIYSVSCSRILFLAIPHRC